MKDINFVKKYRKEKGWTQEALAELLGVSRITVARWEIQKSQPRRNRHATISSTLGAEQKKLFKTIYT